MTRDLRVWSTLEVGPVQLEKRRLRMPYVVHHRDGTQQQAVLTLRWASDVFDPTDLADQQLATLAGAQLGLNYGLFADELVLHGPLDAIDAEWLEEMLDNVAKTYKQQVDVRIQAATTLLEPLMIVIMGATVAFIVAAIMLPLGFITGLLGINVGGLPLTHSTNGFWIVTGALVILVAIQVYFFRKQKWL